MNNTKSIIKWAFLASFLVLTIVGCKKDFENINDDPNSPGGTIRTSFLLSGAQKGLMDFTWDAFWGAQTGNQLAQYWSSNQYASESRYQFRTSVTNGYWTRLYAGGNNDADENMGGINELQTIINLCKESPSEYIGFGDPNNQIAVATIMKVWAMQMITDTWGDAPYSEAWKGFANTQPKYDSQRDIYIGLLNELNGALSLINEGADGPTGDLIYSGNMSAWRKFANSLKMRLAIRMSDRESAMASTAINEALADGIFTSNADNAMFNYLPSVPNTNLYYYNRYIDSRIDYAGSNILVDQLLALEDPRISAYVDQNSNGEYVGEVYGLTDADATATANADISQRSSRILEADAPGIYMAYAETQFILAEAVERGFIGGSASDYYNAGITASMEYWLIEGVDTDDVAGAIATYLARPDVDYASVIGGGATWKQAIGKQKWLALYMQGFEGWSEYRRLDFGILQLPAGGVLDGSGIPLRMMYPVDEQTLNSANYGAAVGNQGADSHDTRVWWDVN